MSIKNKRIKDKEYSDNKISITNLQNSLVIKHGNTILTGVEFYRILGLNAEADKRIKYYKKLLRDYELNPYTERQIEIENPIYIIVQQIIGSGSIVFGFGSWLIEDFPPPNIGCHHGLLIHLWRLVLSPLSLVLK